MPKRRYKAVKRVKAKGKRKRVRGMNIILAKARVAATRRAKPVPSWQIWNSDDRNYPMNRRGD